MKRLLLGLLVVVVCAVPIRAQNTARTYGAWILGTQEQVWARLGMNTNDGQVGLYATYLENTVEGRGRFGGGVYGTYDILATNLGIIGLPDTPSKVYVGAAVGPLEGAPLDPKKIDVMATLMVGAIMGPVVVEGVWLADQELWTGFPALRDDLKFSVGIYIGIGPEGAKLGP